jgi:hypothetical protein
MSDGKEHRMPLRIRNLLTSHPVVVPLNTGTALRLSPGQRSDELPDLETKDNAKVDRLRREGVIEVVDAAEEEQEQSAAEAEAPEEQATGEAEPRPRSRRRAPSSKQA